MEECMMKIMSDLGWREGRCQWMALVLRRSGLKLEPKCKDCKDHGRKSQSRGYLASAVASVEDSTSRVGDCHVVIHPNFK